MARTRTPKELVARVDVSYYKRPHPLRRWMRFLVLLAAALSGVWLVVETLRGDETPYMPGPVSVSHAMFEQTCTRCHGPTEGAIYRRRVSDRACLRCHDGPIHHRNQAFTPACADCHTEHRGRAFIARVSDRHCTQCHARLVITAALPHAAQCVLKEHRIERHIEDFQEHHPEFAVLRLGYSDRARMKLNHQVHLKPGLKGLERLGDDPGVIDDDGRARLACSYCHEPDARGRYMRPIQYEKHCMTCHP
ncbi:MAG: hypothetical protein D6723_15205, partial [Acidobacteria bacterium]